MSLDDAEAHLYWWAVYFAGKAAARVLHLQGSTKSWDDTSLFHNVLSVFMGAYAISTYGADRTASCAAFSDPAAVVIAMQAIHSISDFIVYADEMIKQPIFIAHHAILIVVTVVLPTCPGCMWTSWAMTVAEAGSATIAIDALWRKHGFREGAIRNRRLNFQGYR